MSCEIFYIQHKGYCGNCLIWWRIGGHGYTCDIDKAWKVSAEKAADICKARPDEDRPRLASQVEALSSRHVSTQLSWI